MKETDAKFFQPPTVYELFTLYCVYCLFMNEIGIVFVFFNNLLLLSLAVN
jgi:hypothetical protein